MEKYTIYCTEEQTKKALELGAPISSDWNFHYNGDEKEVPYFRGMRLGVMQKIKPPTTEQMIGWLEEQGIGIDVSAAFGYDNEPTFLWRIGFRFNDFESDAILYSSRKEATLAAIDAALDYLLNSSKA